MVKDTTVCYTLLPGIASKVVFKTLPGGVCTLHSEEETDRRRSLKFFADQEGIISFHVRPSSQSESLVKIIIDCDVDGNVTQFPLELKANSEPTTEMPFPPFDLQRQDSQASVLPALSDNDAIQLSEEEIQAKGYPPRPNPQKMAHAFSVWRRAFSIPRSMVDPITVVNPDVRHDLHQVSHAPAPATGSSSNWSGFVLNSGGPYCVVTGVWNVPSVYSRAERENNITTYSCEWVGIDGWGTSDLVQAGTEQDSLDIHDLTFSNYYVWTEFLPQQPTEQVVSNFPIFPGDEMYVSVWMGDDAKSKLDLAGTNGLFWLTNLTTSKHTLISTPRGSTVVNGDTAEWIVERPTVDGKLPDLAPYSSAKLSGASAAGCGSGSGVWYSGDSTHRNLQVAMVNDAVPIPDTLSSVAPMDGVSMSFSWQRFH